MTVNRTPTVLAGRVRRTRGRLLVSGLVAALVLPAATLVLVSTIRTAPDSAQASAVAAAAPAAPRVVPVPRAAVRNVQAGQVPWDRPLGVSVTRGTLTQVAVSGPDRRPVPGRIGGDGVFRSTSTLVPSSTYRVSARVRDAAGRERTVPLVARTGAAKRLLTAELLSPGAGKVVGVGQPVRIVLDRDVESKAARAAVERRLSVTTTPRVAGSWHWMSDRELHYRGARFWAPRTSIAVRLDLTGLGLPGGTWGSGRRTTSFTTGDALTSTVDVAAKTMTVARNGKVLRSMPASMGKPGFETRNGTFLVLEKFEDKVMDSATLALPAGEASYRTAVRHAVRITNSGTFTHGAPWSVDAQGRRNVSHGCINLSPSNASWYFDQVRRGDVVTVVNSGVGPNSWDAGSQDWNMSFAQWRSGSALV